MWPLTVLPLLLLLLCSGLAGQVGARRAGGAQGAPGRERGLRGFPQKRGLGLHEPLQGCEGRRSQRGRGWNVHSGFGEKKGGFKSRLRLGWFGGHSDPGFRALNSSVTWSPPHPPSRWSRVGLEGNFRGLLGVLTLHSPHHGCRCPASEVPHSSPAPPVWRRGRDSRVSD